MPVDWSLVTVPLSPGLQIEQAAAYQQTQGTKANARSPLLQCQWPGAEGISTELHDQRLRTTQQVMRRGQPARLGMGTTQRWTRPTHREQACTHLQSRLAAEDVHKQHVVTQALQHIRLAVDLTCIDLQNTKLQGFISLLLPTVIASMLRNCCNWQLMSTPSAKMHCCIVPPDHVADPTRTWLNSCSSTKTLNTMV